MYRYVVRNSAGKKVVVEAKNDEQVRDEATAKFDRMYEEAGDEGLIPVAWDLWIVSKEKL